MNVKTKATIAMILVAAITVAVLYATPVFAAANGDSDRLHDRDRDRLRDGSCGNCSAPQNQEQTCSRLRACLCGGYQVSVDGMNLQHQYKHQYVYSCGTIPA